MFGLLPVLGGLLFGWLLPRRRAVIAQSGLYLLSVTATLVALQDRDDPPNAAGVALAMTVVAALALVIGRAFGARRERARSRAAAEVVVLHPADTAGPPGRPADDAR